MSLNISNISKDLRGAGSLTVDAIKGITDITESLHQAIISFGGILGGANQSHTNGITGVVYKNIRNVTQLVGSGIDAVLDSLVPKEDYSDNNDVSPSREAIVSALNGVLGDHLVKRDNPLAIKMQLRSKGKPLNRKDIFKAIEKSDGKVAIMVHGLCMNDLQWNRNGHDHGEALARDLGYLPLYLHYNTGLHISENGKKFSDILETVISPNSSNQVKLVIIGHSMGGLVSKSGCYYGKKSGHKWLNHLDKLIFLGTPHHGAPLAKAGSWIDNILELNPYSSPFAKLVKIRSCGLTDLCYGNVVDDDWKGRDRFSLSRDRRNALPLPEGIDCYSIAVTTFKEPYNCGADLAGDGLVTLSSALGYHRKKEFNLLFPKQNKWIGSNINHIDILNNHHVYRVIKNYIIQPQAVPQILYEMCGETYQPAVPQ